MIFDLAITAMHASVEFGALTFASQASETDLKLFSTNLTMDDFHSLGDGTESNFRKEFLNFRF
jgi:hypothetical protein